MSNRRDQPAYAWAFAGSHEGGPQCSHCKLCRFDSEHNRVIHSFTGLDIENSARILCIIFATVCFAD